MQTRWCHEHHLIHHFQWDALLLQEYPLAFDLPLSLRSLLDTLLLAHRDSDGLLPALNNRTLLTRMQSPSLELVHHFLHF